MSAVSNESIPTVLVLGKYTDGLHVSYSGTPKEGQFQVLKARKGALLTSRKDLKKLGAIPDVPGGPMYLTTRGSRKYPLVLENRSIKHLALTNLGQLPPVTGQFRAGTLHQLELGEVEAIVEGVGEHFFEPGFSHMVSRFDYALDFQCPAWEWPEVKDCITRADWRAPRSTELEFGAGSGKAPQVVIYDKTAEIAKYPDHGWVREEWASKEGYDEGLPVIRVEFRYPRKALKAHGVDTIADLGSGLGGLVKDVVGGEGKRPRFRVASPQSRGRKTDRREPVPWWEEVSRAFLDGLPETPERVLLDRPYSGVDFHRTRASYVTNAVKFAAWDMLNGSDHADFPEYYLCPAVVVWLPVWLKRKRFYSWQEAVTYHRDKILLAEEECLLGYKMVA